jgi:hypothetical protein
MPTDYLNDCAGATFIVQGRAALAVAMVRIPMKGAFPMKPLALLAILALSACAVSPTNCDNAASAVMAAQAAKAVADMVAANNPQSAKMQQAAILAAASLEAAMAVQSTVCPKGE